MALESAVYISDLNVANPSATDLTSQGDDHLRLIKSTLKATFPNINGACNATPLQMNQGFVPIGLIAMWSGSASAVPTGWALCDGTTYSKSDGSGSLTTPDLRGMFIQGSGASALNPTATPTIGTTGGTNSMTATLSVDGTALTQANLPNYNLTVTDPGHTHVAAVSDPGHTHTLTGWSAGLVYGGSTYYVLGSGSSTVTSNATTGITVTNTAHTTGITVSSGGSGTTHTHTGTTTFDNRPAFFTLAFIIKV